MPSATRRALAAAAALPLLFGPLPAQEIRADRLRAHTAALAHDSMDGRGAASAGERRAAAYLAARLAEVGLRPLPGQRADFRLPVPLVAFRSDDDAARMLLRGPDGARALRPPAFYARGGAVTSLRDFGGPLLYAGPTPGALAALAGRSDVAGAVIVLAPPFEGADAVEAELARRGAAGTLSLVPDDAFYHRLRMARGPTRFALTEPVADVRNQGPLPAAVGGAELTRALRLTESIGEPIASARALGLEVDVRFAFARADALGWSVAGWVPGHDPTLAEQAVVLVAHYDHVSGGDPAAGDSIWNGFLDNAAGVAILLEVARAIAERPPARSLVFLFTTAEEQGLLGASWFAHRGVWPTRRLRAALNVDGGAPPGDPVAWRLAGGASEAGRAATAALEALGYGVEAAPLRPDSDHWAFHEAGVPALFLYPGPALRGVGEAEAEARYARWFRAHTPHDEWSEDFPFDGMARYARAALAVARALAAAP